MFAWQTDHQAWQRQPEPAVWVTVARIDGSAPREPGARMVVYPDRTVDTIGGGHLEYKAIELAREMLAGGPQRMLERMPLGPSLGQCCGGVAWLWLERLDADDWQGTVGGSWLRAQPLEGGRPLLLRQPTLTDASRLPTTLAPLARECLSSPGTARTLLVRDADHTWLLEWRPDNATPLVLFGAGHVGQALVHVLGTLPFAVTWVDSRPEMFPARVPGNVTVCCTDLPEEAVDEAPTGAWYLVLTHSHALDEQLVERILRQDDFAYCGLIGSQSKRNQFERRLMRRGVSAAAWARLTCPIGLPGLKSKLPAVIAVSVAADLLQRLEIRAVQTDVAQAAT